MKEGLVILIAVISSQIIHWWVKHSKVSSVRASALSSLLFSGILWGIKIPMAETLSAAWLGSSFLGMAHSEVFSSRDLFFGAWIYALLFLFILPYNISLGGSLGVAAFASCGVIRGGYWLVSRFKT